MNLICPKDSSLLEFNSKENFFYCSSCSSKYPIEEGVIVFLDKKDAFYEGEYVNNLTTIKYLPKTKSFLSMFPLWLINSGYPWYVYKYVPEGSTILELGCGGGVNFFGKHYSTTGLDLSHRALKNIAGVYERCIMADASKIPLEDESVDAVVSSYFWEHIKPELKPPMLKEFSRVLKPNGKMIFLYDIETENRLINELKKKNVDLYKELFLEKDGHVGYQSYEENRKIFEQGGFVSIKHIGLERTFLQSQSVYNKLSVLGGTMGLFSKAGLLLNKSFLFYPYTSFLRITDCTIGNLFPINHSRVMVSILEKIR